MVREVIFGLFIFSGILNKLKQIPVLMALAALICFGLAACMSEHEIRSCLCVSLILEVLEDSKI